MDQTTLRLVLLVLGSLLVAGIYLWDKYQRRVQANRFTQPETKNRPAHFAKTRDAVTPEIDIPSVAEADSIKAPDEPFIGDAEKVSPPASESGLESEPRLEPAIKPGADQLSLDLGSERDPIILPDPELFKTAPRLILQLHIVARAEPLPIAQIQEVADILGLQHGDMQIFHRNSSLPDRPLFSLASMLEPGTLPIKKGTEFTTPGLTLFAELPGAKAGSAIYAEMLFIAQRLADLLQADLQDETHSALTKQAIEHTRDMIQEHQRQLELLKTHHEPR